MRLFAVGIALLTAVLLVGCAADDPETAPTAQEPAATNAPAESAVSEEAAAPEEPAEGDAVEVAEVLKFKGTTVDGAAFDGASLAGKPTVLWFWAPWCPTCRGQIPNVSALAKKYDGQVNVVGVAGLSDSDDEIKVFADDTSGVTNLSDSLGDIWKRFSIIEQSVYTVINADGEIVSEGYLKDDELNDLVADLAS